MTHLSGEVGADSAGDAGRTAVGVDQPLGRAFAGEEIWKRWRRAQRGDCSQKHGGPKQEDNHRQVSRPALKRHANQPRPLMGLVCTPTQSRMTHATTSAVSIVTDNAKACQQQLVILTLGKTFTAQQLGILPCKKDSFPEK